MGIEYRDTNTNQSPREREEIREGLLILKSSQVLNDVWVEERNDNNNNNGNYKHKKMDTS